MDRTSNDVAMNDSRFGHYVMLPAEMTGIYKLTTF